ncbi:DAO-domain-containing protein [Atractiella rhizophila]|nr:DAO-domain-containing protein [Atractiella rhizophila]
MPLPRRIFPLRRTFRTAAFTVAAASTSYAAYSFFSPHIPQDEDTISEEQARSLYYSPPPNGIALDTPHPSNTRPSLFWTPPTRQQMIRALKASSVVSPSEEYGDPSSWFNFSSTSREESTKKLAEQENEYDLLIIGGGATGAGTALDAASRGLKVAMVERDDFSSGTSSKSTKLVHGGVRYLQKAVFELDYEQYKLVREALHERKTFLHIAPYLSHQLPIMLPIYKWWGVPYYWSGCKMYDILAGKENMQSSYFLSKSRALEQFPMLKKDSLVGALVYYDGQHNDSRMNMALVSTAIHHGAVAVNHCEVVQLHKKPNEVGELKLCGARVRDVFTGEEWDVKAKGIINATGPFSDGVRKMDDPSCMEIVAPSSGVHITLPNYYSPGKMGLLDPSTSDGRVIFFLPWLGNTIAGTTDALTTVEQHPIPQEKEVDWILDEVKHYLSPDIKVRKGDILSAWSGIRPLVRDPDAKNTESLVRNHMINLSPSGLLTIAGGKWTTYREMSEETVDAALKAFKLEAQRSCQTKEIQLLGSHGWSKLMYIKLIQQFGLETEVAKHLADTYGDRAWTVCSMANPTGKRWPVHGTRIDPNYPFLIEEIIYAVRREFAATATDIIARRTRLSFLNVQAALEALPTVIEVMAGELGWDKKRQRKEFEDSRDFLQSMGLPTSLQNVTYDQVKSGSWKKTVTEQNLSISRALFSHDEMEYLVRKFKDFDVDNDGRISTKDLEKVMSRMGFTDLTKEKLENIIKEVAGRSEGTLQFKDFLDIAAGVKEVHLHSAFSRLMKDYKTDDSTPDPSSDEKDKKQQWFGKRIPVERSGGGT